MNDIDESEIKEDNNVSKIIFFVIVGSLLLVNV